MKKIGTFEKKEVAEKFVEFIEPLTTPLLFRYVEIKEHQSPGGFTVYYVGVSGKDFMKWKAHRHLLDWSKFIESGTKHRHL